MQTKQVIPKQRKKIIPANRGEKCEDIPTAEYEGSKTILKKKSLKKKTE